MGTGKGFTRRVVLESAHQITAMVESHPRSGTVGRQGLFPLSPPLHAPAALGRAFRLM
jgi:hypothetical protein